MCSCRHGRGRRGIAADDGRLLVGRNRWVENFATSPSHCRCPKAESSCAAVRHHGRDDAANSKASRRQAGVETAYTLKRKEFNSSIRRRSFYRGHLYGVAETRGNRWSCMDLNGKELWNSGSLKFGHGPYMIADGMIFGLADSGLLATMEATHEGYRPLAQFQVFENGHDAWGPMAIASGRLIVRDLTRDGLPGRAGGKVEMGITGDR